MNVLLHSLDFYKSMPEIYFCNICKHVTQCRRIVLVLQHQIQIFELKPQFFFSTKPYLHAQWVLKLKPAVLLDGN